MTNEVEVCMTIADVDCIVTVEFKITHASHGGTAPSLSYPGEPPEGPEWEISKITLTRDAPKVEDQIALECPDWLREAIEESDRVADAICEFEADRSRDWED